jgi:hypothetical protein
VGRCVGFVFWCGGVGVLTKCEVVYKLVLKNKLIRHLSIAITKGILEIADGVQDDGGFGVA